MPEAVKPSRRRYRSPVQAEQAELTRRKVLDAARQLFLAHGCAGTTAADVAAEAAVSSACVHLVFGGKRGLLEGVIATAIEISGDEEQRPAQSMRSRAKSRSSDRTDSSACTRTGD
jgi:AcrR family transcriptional regulator